MNTHAQKTKRWVLSATTLLLTLIALIAFVIWNDTREIYQANTAANTKRDALSSVRIARPDFPDIELSKVDDAWRITAPCDIAVNEGRLDPLWSLVNSAAHSYSSLEVDLDTAGLETPLATVYFNDERVDIGNSDLTGERRYILRNERVEFAPEWVLALVSGGISAFADSVIFPAALESLTLTEQGDDSNSDANAASIDGVASEWQSLSAQQVVSLPLPTNDTLLSTWTLDATSSSDANPIAMNLQLYTSYAALSHQNTQCAYVFSIDSLPANFTAIATN